MLKLLINDGYDFAGKVETNAWPAVEIKYRPALADRVQTYLDDSARGGKSRGDAAVKLLAEHVRSWDIEDEKGQPAPVTEATLRRVPYPVREKMVDFVCGYAGTQATDEKNSATG